MTPVSDYNRPHEGASGQEGSGALRLQGPGSLVTLVSDYNRPHEGDSGQAGRQQCNGIIIS